MTPYLLALLLLADSGASIQSGATTTTTEPGHGASAMCRHVEYRPCAGPPAKPAPRVRRKRAAVKKRPPVVQAVAKSDPSPPAAGGVSAEVSPATPARVLAYDFSALQSDLAKRTYRRGEADLFAPAERPLVLASGFGLVVERRVEE